jgi:hypothetical protein
MALGYSAAEPRSSEGCPRGDAGICLQTACHGREALEEDELAPALTQARHLAFGGLHSGEDLRCDDDGRKVASRRVNKRQLGCPNPGPKCSDFLDPFQEFWTGQRLGHRNLPHARLKCSWHLLMGGWQYPMCGSTLFIRVTGPVANWSKFHNVG